MYVVTLSNGEYVILYASHCSYLRLEDGIVHIMGSICEDDLDTQIGL